MKRVITSCITTVASVLMLSGGASAALFDRGNGLIYDSVLDITWLQDMNYSKTSGDLATGSTYRDSAQSWVDSLVYAGYSDWRLPSAVLVGSEEFSSDGSTDVGYNNHRSELGHLYYVDLHNSSETGFTNASFIDGLTFESKSFLNMSDAAYWLLEDGSSGYGMLFDNWDGLQYTNHNGDARATVIAVRDGDVAAVPVPSAIWLLSSGLFGLAGLGQRVNRKSRGKAAA